LDAEHVAREMLSECVRDGQAVREVRSDGLVRQIRQARDVDLRIRTARIDDTVAVVRTDALIWHDDRATMRAKLTPRSSQTE
jgi:hypothetical protein